MLEEFPGLVEGDGNINSKYTANRSMINARTEVSSCRAIWDAAKGQRNSRALHLQGTTDSICLSTFQ